MGWAALDGMGGLPMPNFTADGAKAAMQAQQSAAQFGIGKAAPQIPGASPQTMTGPQATGSPAVDAGRTGGTSGAPRPVDVGPIGEWLKTIMQRATG